MPRPAAGPTIPKRFSEVEDSIAFRLTHPDGLVCQGTSSYSSMAASFVQVHGDQGWAALNPAFAFEEERRLFGKIQGRWFEQKFKVIDEFVLELNAFAECDSPGTRSGARRNGRFAGHGHG